MNLTLTVFVPALLALAGQAKKLIQYDGWADQKVGSSVTLRMETDAGGIKFVEETTLTLLELSAEQAVVEQKKKATIAGRAEPEKTEKVVFGKDKNKEKAPIKVDKEGDEEIEVGGKKLKCHWVEGTSDGQTKAKLWHSKDIPGGFVKGEFAAPDGGAGITIKALSWEKK